MAPPTRSNKQATRGARQIIDENVSTLGFYRNMILGSLGTYLLIMSIFFEFTVMLTVLTIICMLIHTGCFQFMSHMSRAKFAESGQIIDSGVDLNMEGGIAEHIKDIIILTAGVQLLSIISNYFWFLWLLAPFRALWMLWVNIVSPWIFAEPPAVTEKDEKKQRKMERKLARPQYKSY